MDSRTSAFVVGLYVLVVAVVASLGFYAYDRAVANTPTTTPNPPEEIQGTARIGRSPRASTIALATINPSAQDAHASLAVTRDLLEQRTQALNKKNAECQALKAELDESFVLILSILGEDATSERLTMDQTKRAKARLDAELANLKEAVAKSEQANLEREQRITELQAVLMEVDIELEEQQEQAKRLVEAALVEKDVFELMASDVIVHSGASAVPSLVTLLHDERVATRQWAAKMLGQIGPTASEAATSLRELLVDPDASVRAEAKQALTLVGSTQE